LNVTVAGQVSAHTLEIVTFDEPLGDDFTLEVADDPPALEFRSWQVIVQGQILLLVNVVDDDAQP